MSIGEVLSDLRPEFPDITISKLRFLEAEGLVEPYRAPSGYRRYTRDHVARLRYVLTAQRERYLPLRVIREQLSAYDRGEKVVGLSTVAAAMTAPTSPAPAPPPATRAPAPAIPGPGPVSSGLRSAGLADATASASEPATREDDTQETRDHARAERAPARTERAPASTEARLTRAQLVERAGAGEGAIADLEQYGLLAVGPNGYFGPEALTIARIAAQLSEYGLEGRHLRAYRATADREVGLLAQLVPPLARQAGPGGRSQALQTVHELAALCAALHAALVRAGLRQVLGS